MGHVEGEGVATGVWPDFIAPPKYEHSAAGWSDPVLPDFRKIWAVARRQGYAVGLHGSMKRDVDLIAAPWTLKATAPDMLIKALCRALNASEVGPREPKPLGRIAVTLQVDGYVRLIDLSIAPRVADKAKAEPKTIARPEAKPRSTVRAAEPSS